MKKSLVVVPSAFEPDCPTLPSNVYRWDYVDGVSTNGTKGVIGATSINSLLKGMGVDMVGIRDKQIVITVEYVE